MFDRFWFFKEAVKVIKDPIMKERFRTVFAYDTLEYGADGRKAGHIRSERSRAARRARHNSMMRNHA